MGCKPELSVHAPLCHATEAPATEVQRLNRSDQIAFCSYTCAGTGARTSTPGSERQLQRKPRRRRRPGPERALAPRRAPNEHAARFLHAPDDLTTRGHELGFPPPEVQIDAPASQTDRDKGVRCRARARPVLRRIGDGNRWSSSAAEERQQRRVASVRWRRGWGAGASSRARWPRPRPRGARRGRLARGGARGCRACRSARAPPTAFNALPCRERGRRERGTVGGGGGSDAIQARRARSRCRHLAGAGPAAARASDGPLPLAACRRLTCRRQLSHSAALLFFIAQPSSPRRPAKRRAGGFIGLRSCAQPQPPDVTRAAPTMRLEIRSG